MCAGLALFYARYRSTIALFGSQPKRTFSTNAEFTMQNLYRTLHRKQSIFYVHISRYERQSNVLYTFAYIYLCVYVCECKRNGVMLMSIECYV